ncbi:MAG TPA: DUF488 family protein [Methylocella sp.]|jgi:uncharacterized protein YeaO (DUF488 family)
MARVQIKRIYDAPEKSDGVRVLVDRLWPRGVSKKKASLDLWMKELAPSTELRKWFNHDPERWVGFRQRYRHELRKHGNELAALKAQAAKRRVTLLFGARDTLHNEAVVLRDALQSK